jgi:zinc transport system substrate-binding protein
MKLFVNLFLAFFITSSITYAKNFETKKPVIVTSINPIYQIVLAITQDKINTKLIINPNYSEHDYQFRKSDVELISKADLIFYASDELETKFLKLIESRNKENQAFELANVDGIKILSRRDNVNKIDPHIWLNPQNAILIAEFVTKNLVEIDATNSPKYQNNLKKFKQEVMLSVKNVKTHLSKIDSNSAYIFYHDGYQYFENYFAIKPAKIVSYNHSSELTINKMKEIDDVIKKGSVKCIFGEPQDERNSAMRLAQNYKVKFAILDLIGLKENIGVGNGYSQLLKNMADDMVTCLK